MNPRLMAVSGHLSGAIFPVSDGELTLGRDESNKVKVPDMAVSRKHCVIRKDGDGFTLIDLQSRNGSSVNNVPVRKHELRHGDRIEIGDSQFIFLLSEQGGQSDSRTVELDDSRVLAGHTIQLRPEDAVYLQAQRLLESGAPSERQARDVAALLRVCRALDSTRDVATLAKGLLDLILDLVPADRGAVLVAEESGEIRAVYGRWRCADTDGAVSVSRTLVRQVLSGKVAMLCNNVMQDPRIIQTESITASPTSAVLVVPIALREKSTGVIYLATSTPTHRFADDDLELVTGLAGISAPAFESARQLERLQQENQQLHSEIEADHRMVGNSPAMEEVYKLIGKLAPSNLSVLITGESGTGKELVARALHLSSPRSSRRFVAVSCAALTESLLESELFGHEKWAFTGAGATKKGILEVADGGTLFLDEIGETTPKLQSKLLRVLQERQFERVGGTESLKVDIRVIAATNRDLQREIREGRFRDDLYFRIEGVSIHIPPLRERRDDILPLARHFLNRHGRREKRREMQLSEEAQACLARYDWPGNVRELESTIEQAVVLTSGSIIRQEDLSESVRDAGSTQSSRCLFREAVREAQKAVIVRTYKQARGNYVETARLLGLNVNYLHRLIRILDIKGQLKL